MTSTITCACPMCGAFLDTPDPYTTGEPLKCHTCATAFSLLTLPERIGEIRRYQAGSESSSPTMTFTPRGLPGPASPGAENPSGPTRTYTRTPFEIPPAMKDGTATSAKAGSGNTKLVRLPRRGILLWLTGGSVAALGLIGFGALLAIWFGAPRPAASATAAARDAPVPTENAQAAKASRIIDAVSGPPVESNKLPVQDSAAQLARSEPIHADGTLWLGLGLGNRALDIEGEDLDGQPFKLNESLGKVVLLNFWGQWCPYCRQMYPYVNKLRERMAGKKFVLLGVNSDPEKVQAKKTVQSENLRFRSWWDGAATGSPIARQWAISGEPTMYVLDSRGIIRWRHEGVPQELDELDQLIDKLVAQAEGQAPQDAVKTPAQIREELAKKAKDKEKTEQDLKRITDRFSKEKTRRN